MKTPLVSIHIVTYNQINFIHETLKSALEQDYDNIEIIVSDDCSTDGTGDIINYYADRYPKIIKILGNKNIGITKNCNRALKICRGKYVAFQGGDDVLLQGKIRNQVAWMEEDENRVISGHDVEVFDSNTNRILGIKKQGMPFRKGSGSADIIKYGVASFYSGTSIMVRRDAIPEYGFDERLPIVSDWKFVVDCLATGGKFGCIEGIYARYRKHGQSITDLKSTQIFKECIITLGLIESQHQKYLKECKIARSKLFYKFGNYYLKNNDKINSFHYLMASVDNSSSINKIWRFPIFYILTSLPINIFLKISKLYRFFKKKFGIQIYYY